MSVLDAIGPSGWIIIGLLALCLLAPLASAAVFFARQRKAAHAAEDFGELRPVFSPGHFFIDRAFIKSTDLTFEPDPFPAGEPIDYIHAAACEAEHEAYLRQCALEQTGQVVPQIAGMVWGGPPAMDETENGPAIRHSGDQACH
jgi:hypothetical protein